MTETMSYLPSSWHGLPLIAPVIESYAGFKRIAEIYNGNTLLISYHEVWYTLTDNGGEIVIGKVNEPGYHREFPTVRFMGALNSETLMQRLCWTLKGEPIDYMHDEEPFHAQLLKDMGR